jgi:uncharacterized protein (DUF1501 family)
MHNDPAMHNDPTSATGTGPTSGTATATAATAPDPAPAGDRRLDRRKFLALAGGLGAAGLLAGTLGPHAWDVVFGGARDPRGSLGPSAGRRLVLVTLYGGNDGLNTVVPYRNPAYAPSRGPLALDASTLLPLDEGYGLHPALTGFKRLWEQRRLAIVQGVGFADPNYSHFESMDIWQSGVPGSAASTGWVGRWLDGTGSSPLRAVGIGPTTPVVLQGDKVQGASLPAGPIVLPGDATEQSLYAALAGTTKKEALLLADSARSGADLLTVNRRLGPVLDRTATADPLHLAGSGTGAAASSTAQGALAIANGGGGLSSPGVLATQLSIVANLILARSPTQVYSVELGGFDTHTDQAATQQTLLAELDAGVTAFVDSLSDDPAGQDTVVLVYTEFGRRVTGNASAGSDHGWANVVFVAGHGVTGGWYGDPPSLSKLSDGNLVFTTDFRSVYATLFAEVLGVDPFPFLDGRFRTIPFV